MTCPSGPPVTIVERNSPMNLYGMCDVMTSRVVVVAVRERERETMISWNCCRQKRDYAQKVVYVQNENVPKTTNLRQHGINHRNNRLRSIMSNIMHSLLPEDQ
jgi:hypothetical protein